MKGCWFTCTTADHSAIILKVRVPESVGEHDVGRAVGAVFIFRVKEAPQIWLHANDVKVVSRRLQDPDAQWISPYRIPRP